MKKIIVYHSSYGCDTGCCGHTIEILEDDKIIKSRFNFSHPNTDGSDIDSLKEFAVRLVKETYGEDHVKDLDWENCEIKDD